MTDITVQRSASRFEALIDDEVVGYADFVDSDEVRIFPHTVVSPEHGGQGVASTLIKSALDETREDGFKVVARCAFVAGYIEKHPEYQDLLA